MKHYVTFDTEGKIHAQGTTVPHMFDLWCERLPTGIKAILVEAPLENPDGFMVVDGEVVERESPLDKTDAYDFARHKAYNINEQLGFLYKDIDAGLFGAKAKTGQFYAYVKSIKEQYPKP